MLKLTVTCDVCKKEETMEGPTLKNIHFPGWETHNYDRGKDEPGLPEHHICPECYKHMKQWRCLP